MTHVDKYKEELLYYFGTINKIISKKEININDTFKLMIKNKDPNEDKESMLSDIIECKLINKFAYSGQTYIFDVLNEKVLVIAFNIGTYKVVNCEQNLTCKNISLDKYISDKTKIIEIFNYIFDNINNYNKIILCGHSHGFVCATIVSYCLLCLSSNEDMLCILPKYHEILKFIKTIPDTHKYEQICDKLQEKIYICGSGGYPILWESQEYFNIYFNFYKQKYIHLNYGIKLDYTIDINDPKQIILIDPHTISMKGIEHIEGSNEPKMYKNYNMYTMLVSSKKLSEYIEVDYNNFSNENTRYLKKIKDYSIEIIPPTIILNYKILCDLLNFIANPMEQLYKNSLHDLSIYRETFFNYFNSSDINYPLFNESIINLYYNSVGKKILKEKELYNKYLKYKNKYMKLKSYYMKTQTN